MQFRRRRRRRRRHLPPPNFDSLFETTKRRGRERKKLTYVYLDV